MCSMPREGKRKIRVGIIGCGQISEAHLKEIALIPDAEAVAICDLARLLAEDAAVRYGIDKVYSDHRRMLDELPLDVVHITSPPHTHLPIGLDVIAHGCHVYIEKPFGVDFAEAKALIDAARAQHVIVCAGFGQLYDLVSLRLGDFIAGGHLGDVVHMETYYGNSLGGNFSRLFIQDRNHWIHRLPGKLFQNIISHALYHIVPYMNHPVDQIACFAKDRSRTGVFFDELRVMMQSGDVSAYLTFTSAVQPVTQFVKIYGTAGIAEMDLANHTFSHIRSTSLPGPVARCFNAVSSGRRLIKEGLHHAVNMSAGKDRFFAGMGGLFERLYENIRLGDMTPPVPYDVVLACSSIMDEIGRQCTLLESRRPSAEQ